MKNFLKILKTKEGTSERGGTSEVNSSDEVEEKNNVFCCLEKERNKNNRIYKLTFFSI